MKSGILAIVWALNVVQSCQAQEWETWDVMMLTYYSPIIFTATPLHEKEFMTWTIPDEQNSSSQQRTRRFVVQDRIRIGNTDIPDTIEVCGWEEYRGLGKERQNAYYEDDYEEHTKYSNDFFNFFVFFGSYHGKDERYSANTFKPTNSGIRPFFQDTMYLPDQFVIPGPYTFVKESIITHHEFSQKIYRAMSRWDSLLNLRQIQPPAAQNKALLDWVEAHLEELKNSEVFARTGDRENNWGPLKWQIFQWIDEHEIWQDSWRGIELSSKVSNDVTHCYGSGRGSGFAFANPEARTFLLEQIQDSLLHKNTSDCALRILERSLWKRPEERGAPRTFDVTTEERREIIKTALILLDNKDEYIRSNAMRIIETVAFPQYKELEDFYDAPTLRALKNALERESATGNRSHLRRILDKMQSAQK